MLYFTFCEGRASCLEENKPRQVYQLFKEEMFFKTIQLLIKLCSNYNFLGSKETVKPGRQTE